MTSGFHRRQGSVAKRSVMPGNPAVFKNEVHRLSAEVIYEGAERGSVNF